MVYQLGNLLESTYNSTVPCLLIRTSKPAYFDILRHIMKHGGLFVLGFRPGPAIYNSILAYNVEGLIIRVHVGLYLRSVQLDVICNIPVACIVCDILVQCCRTWRKPSDRTHHWYQ